MTQIKPLGLELSHSTTEPLCSHRYPLYMTTLVKRCEGKCSDHSFVITGSANVKVPQSTKEAENLLLNVAGKLLVFQRDRSGPQIKEKEEGKRMKQVRINAFLACGNFCGLLITFANSMDKMSGLIWIQLFDTLKVLMLKNSSRRQKSMQKLPNMQRVNG